MTTEEYIRQYMPGDLEREKERAHFDVLLNCAESGVPLPDGYDSVLETATVNFLKAKAEDRRKGFLPPSGYDKAISAMRLKFQKEFRERLTVRNEYARIQEMAKTLSVVLSDFLKNVGEMTIEEREDKFLTLFGLVFTKVEENVFRKRIAEGEKAREDKPKKAGKAGKKPAEVRHKYGEYQNVLLSDSEYQKLKDEFPDDYAGRIEILSEYIASSGKAYKSHLATLRMWAKKDWKKLKSEKKKPACFSNDAAYDLSRYESQNIGLLFIDNEKSESEEISNVKSNSNDTDRSA